MTVRKLIQKLLDNCNSLDDNVRINVFAKTETIKEYMKLAESYEWCFDEVLQIDEIENRAGQVWLEAEEIL